MISVHMSANYLSRAEQAEAFAIPTGKLPDGRRIHYAPPESIFRLFAGVIRSLFKLLSGCFWIVLVFIPLVLLLPVHWCSPDLYTRLRRLLMRNMAKGMFAIAGAKLRRSGRRPTRPAIFVSNHLSWLDIVAYTAEFSTVFVAMDRIAKWPLIGTLAKRAGAIFINRRKIAHILPVNAAIQARLDDKEIVTIFCEAGVSNGLDVLAFKSPLLEYPAELEMPVFFGTMHYAIPKQWGRAAGSLCWIDWTPFMLYVCRLLRVPGIELTISYGKAPISGTNRKTLAKALEEEVRKLHTPLQ